MPESYCRLFGSHKSDPCPCGWSSRSDVRCFLDRSIKETSRMIEDAKSDEHGEGYRQFLNGLMDGFQRVRLFLDSAGD